MAKVELTEFQTHAQVEVQQLLTRRNRVIESQEVFRADVPFYSKDVEIAIKIVAGDVEIWLYDNEASYSFHGDSKIFERSDFDSLDELTEAFLSALNMALSEVRRDE